MWNQILVEGWLSQVSSQPAMIPSSLFFLSRDQRLPLDTCNQSGSQENVLGNQLSTSDSPRDHPQRIQSDDVQRNRETAPQAGRTKTMHPSEDRQNQGTIPMPTFATRPLTTSSAMPVEFPKNCMVGQQRQQTSELRFDKFPDSPFFVRKLRFKAQVTNLATEMLFHGVCLTGGGGLARVPNLRVCKHPFSLEGGTRREKGELTSWSSRRGNTSCESQRRENRAARKGEWSPRGSRTTVLNCPCPSQPCSAAGRRRQGIK